MVWKLLLGYLPTNEARRIQTLERKRAEYKDAMAQHYHIDDNARTIQEQETLRQVLVDVPRTAPDIPLFRNERIKRALARVLYIWAMRHPASSYVQGINDLATPLFVVFLSDYYNGQDVLDGNVMFVISDERLEEVGRLECSKTHVSIPRGLTHKHFTRFSSLVVLGGSRRLLVFDKYFGRDSRSLYGRSTGSPTHGHATGRIGPTDR